MNTYEVKCIDWKKLRNATYEEVKTAIINQPTTFCEGIDELRSFCGGRLSRCRNVPGSWWALNNGVEYQARKL